ncbi:hypothetical protein PR048_021351 [Dryococelus australis]|uniref:Uncharacterized protein n=1 Tax=Dryococelus australis TaxID=614101 RepID=A0ABQ9GXX8_9NEOP|nr:hypothetical protein PR048_021351 [Dryococelus australis]
MKLEVLVLVALCGGALTHVGFEWFPGVGYYKMHHKHRSWNDAKDICEKEDSHLVIINSEQEFLTVKDFMERYGEPGMLSHAGFHDQFDDGHFVDLLGEYKLLSYPVLYRTFFGESLAC